MKSMSDRALPMRAGEPKSEAFFPEEPHHEELMKVGQIRGIDYPDTQEDIHHDQDQALTASDRGRQVEGYRH